MPRISRKEFLHGAAAASALRLTGSQALARTAKRPNVLLVLVDEWRAQAFGYAGDRNAPTPAIDRFAGESVNFPLATSGTPVCSPARASLLTGQYPLQHGVYINDVPLRPNGPTLGECFARAGYQTGYIGKWHVYGSPDGSYGRRLAYIPREHRLGFDYWKACECTHNYNRSLYYEGDDPTARYWPGYDAIAQTRDAIGFIEKSARSNDPFLLVLSWGPPHFPYMAPAKYEERFAEQSIELRPNVPADRREAGIQELRRYYAAAAVLDDCFRDLMDALAREGLEDDTIVLFTSDHGEMAWSQGLLRKLVPWEESVGVPLLIRYPRLLDARGRRSSAPLGMPDIMPTLLGLSGIAVPEHVSGTDYSPLVRGQAMPNRASSAYLSVPAPVWDARMIGAAAFRGVRTERFTYVRSIQGPWLLYDNRADPFQKRNRVGDPALADARAELERQLMDWRTRLNDEFLPAETYLRRDGLTHYVETYVPVGVNRSPWNDWASTLDVPPWQPRSIDASFDQLARDPLAASLLAPLMPAIKGITAVDWRVLSPRIINILQPQALPDVRLAELDIALRRLPRPEDTTLTPG